VLPGPQALADAFAGTTKPWFELLRVFESFRQAVGIPDDEWHELEPVDWEACQEMASVSMDEFEAALDRCRAAGDLSQQAVLADIRRNFS